MVLVGQGRIAVWSGAALWLIRSTQRAAEISPHAHHAIQVTFALEGRFEVTVGDCRIPGPVAAISADIPHTFQGTGTAAFLFVEPESSAGRSLISGVLDGRPSTGIDHPAFVRTRDELRRYLATEHASNLEAIGRRLLANLPSPAALPDSRAMAMIAYARANIDGPITLSGAADRACLSPDRARHVFVGQTGLPFKTFVLWLRLERAVSLYASGASLTEAAHEAGFADSAHLSRTFRRTFGLPAGALDLTAG